jgi:taurine dioxygenase
MKYHIHENGWTVIVDEIDLKTIDQNGVTELAKLIAKNTCVVIRDQFLSVQEEVRVIKMFKDPYSFDPDNRPMEAGYKNCVVSGSEGHIIRVTADVDEHGNPGFAGDTDELKWHCNDATRSERRAIVWLYGIKGTAGSRTTWNNNVLSYSDLDQDTKDKLQPLRIRMQHWKSGNAGKEDYAPNLVVKNIAGVTSLFFPFLQIRYIDGMTPEESKTIMDPLIEHTTQEKYLYHHDWRDGDLIISDQWSGIHKRWPFPYMKDRLLHRIVFNYPDQDYTI